MAKLDVDSLTSVDQLLNKSDYTSGKFFSLGTGRLNYWNKNESSPIEHIALQTDSNFLANWSFSGAIKTTSFYMPPGSSKVVMSDSTGNIGIGGLDLGGMSYQIMGSSSNYVFQIIQGTIVPHISLTGAGDADLTIQIYPPLNIFGEVTTFGLTPLFLVVGMSHDEYSSSDNMRRDFGVQPYGSPFQWNDGKPYIKLRCRGGVNSKKIHYTQILAR